MPVEKITMFALGGTIASRKSESGRAQSGAMSGEELARTLGIEVDVQIETLCAKPSNAISFQDLLMLRDACRHAVTEGTTGIVVTQGTDTLEDTAYFLHLILDLPVPVVVTGAQRVPYAVSSDAGANVRDAITVARQGALSGKVVVVFDEEVHGARAVRKVSSYRLGGFGSPGHGPLGFVDGGHVTLRHEDREEPRFAIAADCPMPRVDILPVALGIGPELLEAAASSGADGLILDGIGRGQVPPDWMPVLQRLRGEGLPIAIVSSTLSGRLQEDYEYTGALMELTAIGVTPVHELSARKARLHMICDLASRA